MNNSKRVRTRYAPSPTGYLHIGGARTALFCYLFAKKMRGDFLIRIEDTDMVRHVDDGEISQLANLEWLGVIADESPLKDNPQYGPYRQSMRLATYKKYLDELLTRGLAYECFDTVEEIQEQKRAQTKTGSFSFRYDRHWLKISDAEKAQRRTARIVSYRLQLPRNHTYVWNDIVRGEITINASEISEFVIFKSDGMPTYNFANVIDDHLMEITHVFRGEEHTSNTPKQLALYEMFGWQAPEFGHFTIITNHAHVKLSKRDQTLKQFIEQYRDDKYVPHAIFNFLSLLGWSSPDAKEIMSKDELIRKFDVARLSQSPTIFDINKMNWMANQYFKKLPLNELREYTLPFIEDKVRTRTVAWVDLLLQTYQPQMYCGKQIVALTAFYFNNPVMPTHYAAVLGDKAQLIRTFALALGEVAFELEGIKKAIGNTQKQTQLTGKEFFMPLRMAATFQEHGPELHKVIFLLGEKLVKARLEEWVKLLNSNQ